MTLKETTCSNSKKLTARSKRKAGFTPAFDFSLECRNICWLQVYLGTIFIELRFVNKLMA